MKTIQPLRRPSLDAFRIGAAIEIEGVHFKVEKVTGKRIVLEAMPRRARG